jgi:predicted amino acid racemase
MLEASYTGNVAKRLRLKAGVYYGVNDLFQQVNGIQNLKGVNIGIKYEIFDK